MAETEYCPQCGEPLGGLPPDDVAMSWPVLDDGAARPPAGLDGPHLTSVSQACPSCGARVRIWRVLAKRRWRMSLPVTLVVIVVSGAILWALFLAFGERLGMF